MLEILKLNVTVLKWMLSRDGGQILCRNCTEMERELPPINFFVPFVLISRYELVLRRLVGLIFILISGLHLVLILKINTARCNVWGLYVLSTTDFVTMREYYAYRLFQQFNIDAPMQKILQWCWW